VKKATGVEPPLPEHLSDLLERVERIVDLPNDLQAVEEFVAACQRS
jgi:threonine synthase